MKLQVVDSRRGDNDVKRVNIYTATSLKSPKRQSGAVCYILEMNTEKGPVTLTKTELIRDATENLAELTTVVNAVKRLKESCELNIYTESSYVAAGFTQGWMKQWKKTGWKNAKGLEIANKTGWESLLTLSEKHIVTVHLNEHNQYSTWLEREVMQKAEGENRYV